MSERSDRARAIKEQMQIEQRGKKIWDAIGQHIDTAPHGNGIACTNPHQLAYTSIRLYFVSLNADEESVSSSTAERIAVIAITRHFPEEEIEESNWRFTKDGHVTREGVLIKSGKRDLFTSNPPLQDGSTQHGVLEPELKDLNQLLEIATNPDAGIVYGVGMLSKLSEKLKKVAETNSPAQSAGPHS